MKRTILLLILFASLCNTNAQQNVGIGTTTPNASAALDITSTNKGLLLPRMTFAQRNAIASPSNGLMVYQTDSVTGIYNYVNHNWIAVVYQIEPKEAFKTLDTITYSGVTYNYVIKKGVRKIRLTTNSPAGGYGLGLYNYSASPCASNYSGTGTFNPQLGEMYQLIINVQENDTLKIKVGQQPTTTATNSSGGFPDGNSGNFYNYRDSYTIGGGYFDPGASTCDWTNRFVSGGAGGSNLFYLKRNNIENLIASLKGGNGGSQDISNQLPGIGNATSISNVFVTSATQLSSSNALGFVIIEETFQNNQYNTFSSNSGGASVMPYASTNSEGIITGSNFNSFSNKIDGSGIAAQVALFNGSKQITGYNDFVVLPSPARVGVGTTTPSNPLEVVGNAVINGNLQATTAKISSLASSNSQLLSTDSTGKLILSTFSASGDNMGNHNASQNIQSNGHYISFDGSNNGLHINSSQNVGISTLASTNSKLRVNSASTGTGFANWIAGDFGGTSGDRVVLGIQNGEATIAGHTNALNAWAGLTINPTGIIKMPSINNSGTKMVTVGPDGTLASQTIATGNVGTVTNVTGTGAITVTNNTTTPTITVAQANTNAMGVLSSNDWNTFNNKQSALSNANASINGILTATDWNTFNNKQNTLSNANVSTNGILTSTDWTTFNNKQNALANANTSTNGILTSTDWNTFNNKQNALVNANGASNGILTATDWTTFNNKASVPASNNGQIMYGNNTNTLQGSTSLIWNNTNARLGVGTNSPTNKIEITGTGGAKISSSNTGTGTADWIATNVGGTAGSRVVIGNLFSTATIGAHKSDLSGWDTLSINPGGNGALIILGGDKTQAIPPVPQAITIGSPYNGANKVVASVNGSLRQAYYTYPVSIAAGQLQTITWNHNFGKGPILMMSTDGNGQGGNFDIVNVTYTYFNNNENSVTFKLKNNGTTTAAGNFNWIVVH